MASDLSLEQAHTLVIVVPATRTDRAWPNHVRLRGDGLAPEPATFAMTEQPRTLARDRTVGEIGHVDAATMREVDGWLRDFLALP